VGWQSLRRLGSTPSAYVKCPDPKLVNWGMDHWASRVGQGTYLNWVVGNAILPDEDPEPDS
jgi:hypothetical protein